MAKGIWVQMANLINRVRAWLGKAEHVMRVFRDFVAALLALGVFGVYLALLFTHLVHPTTDIDSIEVAKEIATILGPLVAVIFGFYFGERSGNSRAEAATATASEKTTRNIGQLVKHYEREFDTKLKDEARKKELNQLFLKVVESLPDAIEPEGEEPPNL